MLLNFEAISIEFIKKLSKDSIREQEGKLNLFNLLQAKGLPAGNRQ